MAESRTLKLSILADVDQLRRGLNQADQEVAGFGDKVGKWSKMAGAAFAAAGVAAAAYASTLLVDGVKAAIEDQKAQEKLATTLENVTGATDAQIAAVEEYVTATSLAYGVTDDELRPSLERLARATKDTTKAQELQKLALDVAAGSGKSLEAVTNAISKAYEGNTGALGKLGVGIDAATLKSMSFDEVTAALSKTFEGQASKQADTFAGKMDRLKIAFDEGKETVGGYLLDAITPLISNFVDKTIPAIQKGAQALSTELGPQFKDLTTSLKENVIPLVQKLAPIVGTVLVTAFKVLVPVLTTTFSILSNIVGAITTVITKIRELARAIAESPIGTGIGAALDLVLPGRASGGPVSAGSPYVVGEKGPEVFVPRTSGTIIPNGAGGSTTNIYVSGAIDPAGVARQIADLLNREATNSGTFSNLGISRSYA